MTFYQLPTAPPPFRLYAEVLRNIRSASVVAVLEERTVIESAVAISQGSSVELTINGVIRSVNLPAPMETIPKAIATERRPVDELVLRYALETGHPSDSTPGARGAAAPASDHDNVVPWDAEHMEHLARTLVRGEAVCRGCRAPFLKLEAMHGWKDLPREGWEESLDMWHCHRPHGNDGDKKDDQNGNAMQIDGNDFATGSAAMRDDDKNGSGDAHDNHAAGPASNHPATNRVQITPGYGLVGLLYWLVDKADCYNVQVRVVVFFFHHLFPPPGGKEGGFAGAWLQTPWRCLRYNPPRSMQAAFERRSPRLHVPRLRGSGFACGPLRTKYRRRVVLAATR
jgi:HECT-like Ubiquitin-conjugating enzyme (E2)-binding